MNSAKNSAASITMSKAMAKLWAALKTCTGPGPVVNRIDPPFWWVGMKAPELQLMVYGPGIGEAIVSIDPYPGVGLSRVVRLDSPNYLLIYLDISRQPREGDVIIRFSLRGRGATVAYRLLRQLPTVVWRQGFSSEDVMYLVMPDRFARAKPRRADVTCPEAVMQYPSQPDRSDDDARHGGNLNGLRRRLDYFVDLGVTALWVTPVFTNDMPGGSYHGYAVTDYYSIDPRLGTMDEWCLLVRDAHRRGLKVVMDMIFNHTGSQHPWNLDRPTKDWYNCPSGDVTTNYRLSTIHDPYASDYDRRRTTDGWFVGSMPDLNQRCPHVMRYLTQMAVWWVGYSGIDGIRMDTYPYADFDAMARWVRDMRAQFPWLNIVGECWLGTEAGVAFWQRDSRINRRGNPELPTVMDFALESKARNAFSEQTGDYSGLAMIYDHLTLDFLFPDPQNVLTFFDNHDTNRFLLSEPDEAKLRNWKQAMTFLLTSRGIPQIYYGTELLMYGTKDRSDGRVRRDFPGGFPGDTIDCFRPSGRSRLQNHAFNFLRRLLRWRRGNEVIARGELTHFIPFDGIYAYRRKLGEQEVVVVMNGTDSRVTVDTRRLAEILPPDGIYTDALTRRRVVVQPCMKLAPRAVRILERGQG